MAYEPFKLVNIRVFIYFDVTRISDENKTSKDVLKSNLSSKLCSSISFTLSTLNSIYTFHSSDDNRAGLNLRESAAFSITKVLNLYSV